MTDEPTRRNGDTDFDPIAFLEDAVEIPSHTTDGVAEMRAYLVETLERFGLEPAVDDAGNVLVSRESTDPSGPHYVLNTHIDTVSPHVPLEVVTESDSTAEGTNSDGRRVCGRGSCDAKGQVAALLSAFLDADLDSNGDSAPGCGRVTLAITPDEELLSTGAHALVSRSNSLIRHADGFIVGEPTGLDVCSAAKGRFEGTIELTGVNAHAAEPQSGINAISALESVLGALETFDDRDDAPPVHPDLGGATLTPTVVRGGEATNQVPDSCQLTIDRRSVPPETATGFHEALLEHLNEAVPADVGVDFSFTDRPTPLLEAWETDPTDPLVTFLQEVSGGSVRPFSAATEASYFAAHAPTVVFGPGVLADEDGAVAHSPREYVRAADVLAGAGAVRHVLEHAGELENQSDEQ